MPYTIKIRVTLPGHIS